jgi:hypothetical protein
MLGSSYAPLILQTAEEHGSGRVCVEDRTCVTPKRWASRDPVGSGILTLASGRFSLLLET